MSPFQKRKIKKIKMRGWNFSAGPAAIPQEVIKEVQEELLEYNGSGASIIEIGHRTDIYSQVAEESKNDRMNQRPERLPDADLSSRENILGHPDIHMSIPP